MEYKNSLLLSLEVLAAIRYLSTLTSCDPQYTRLAQFCEAEKRSPHIKKSPSAPASAMTRHSMKAA